MGAQAAPNREAYSKALHQAQACAAQLKRADYLKSLRAQDWSFEFSDDGRAYRAGRDSLAALRTLQAEIDPDAAIWNTVAPAAYRLEGVAQ